MITVVPLSTSLSMASEPSWAVTYRWVRQRPHPELSRLDLFFEPGTNASSSSNVTDVLVAIFLAMYPNLPVPGRSSTGSVGPVNGVEKRIRRTVGVAVGIVTAVLVAGVARSHREPAGRTTGAADRVLRPSVEAAIGVGLTGAAALAWRPLPYRPSRQMRMVLDVTGGSLALSGLGLALWGKVALGEFYAASSAAGVRLHAEHRLITSGPFAIVRHPMYVGIEMTTLGSLLLYRTWATLMLWLSFFGLVVRARQEDHALRLEFGAAWDTSHDTVPGWFPRPRRPAGVNRSTRPEF